jgi:shikimate dehydrogenase
MRKFGLIGKTLDHSFSKSFFTEFFDKENIDAVYSNYELKEISEIADIFNSNSISGLNVTIPYKQSVIPLLDELSEEASSIGAVNVIQFKNGKTIGHNSDAFGFHQSIKPFLTNLHERALIIGTGGASKAVDYVFKSLGIDTITISRNPVGDKQFGYDDINNHMLNACKVVVHCTPIGTFPNEEDVIQFPFEFLTKDHLVVDLIYNPEKTKFLRLAQEQGATILNGESMLQQQALKAWEIWNK